MEQNFDLLAQSRANYYTPGSPVQFVRVELLKGDMTGEIAVCLTFKNVSAQVLNGLVIKFKCKTPAGVLVCEDQFRYEDLNAGQGALFGSDDAVYISDQSISSVEVELDRALDQNGRAIDLSGFSRRRLPPPKALPAELAERLRRSTGKQELSFVPQVIEEGWYCACGAFHPKAEDTVYCSECGSDRILLQNALSGMLQKQEEPTRVVQAPPSEPTRVMQGEERAATAPAARPQRPMNEQTTAFSSASAPAAKAYAEDADDSDMKMAGARPAPQAAERSARAQARRPAKNDEMAEWVIRWAPPITAILCALTVAIGVVYHFLVQL